MNGNIEVGVEQIIANDSIEELEQLATDNGYDYKDEEQFLTDLAHHWKQLKQANTAVIKQIITDGEPLPTRVPSLDVVVNGKNVSIYGVIHHRLAGKHYFDIVRDTVNEKENWLMEDALPNIF